jgi:hypothetical protein
MRNPVCLRIRNRFNLLSIYIHRPETTFASCQGNSKFLALRLVQLEFVSGWISCQLIYHLVMFESYYTRTLECSRRLWYRPQISINQKLSVTSKSLIMMTKSQGPIFVPLGTAAGTRHSEKHSWLNFTRCLRFCRELIIHQMTLCGISKLLSFRMKIPWSIKSKAVLKSERTTRTLHPLSSESLFQLWIVLTNARVVDKCAWLCSSLSLVIFSVYCRWVLFDYNR